MRDCPLQREVMLLLTKPITHGLPPEWPACCLPGSNGRPKCIVQQPTGMQHVQQSKSMPLQIGPTGMLDSPHHNVITMQLQFSTPVILHRLHNTPLKQSTCSQWVQHLLRQSVDNHVGLSAGPLHVPLAKTTVKMRASNPCNIENSHSTSACRQMWSTYLPDRSSCFSKKSGIIHPVV